VKVAFELPSPVLQSLRSHVPTGKRSRFVTELISEKLRTKDSSLTQAAKKANALRKVNRDMKAWQRLSE
jgi:hypothetical protein